MPNKKSMTRTGFKNVAMHESEAKDLKILTAKIERDYDDVKGISGAVRLLMNYFEKGGKVDEKVSSPGS